MRAHPMKAALLAVAFAGLSASGASAAAGPPPPPSASGGQTVTQIAAGLSTPTGFAFGAGRVFASDAGGRKAPGGVFVLRDGTAVRLPGSPPYSAGVVWRKGTLYISAGRSLLAWSGWNGARFSRHRTLWTGPRRFPGFNGIGFGADGRLYAGVAVSGQGPAGDDHGPTTLPYARDILSFTATGKRLKVVASGIRQPWQMAFPAGSSSPFVSDLGQDAGKGAKRVPDFIVRVAAGQDYGFPTCTWLTMSPCEGSATPFKFFAPHTDELGLGIIGTRLYISEFGGASHPQVVSMPLTGGPVTPLLTGFVAPIVGLATHAGSVYVGELTGQVFRVRP